MTDLKVIKKPNELNYIIAVWLVMIPFVALLEMTIFSLNGWTKLLAFLWLIPQGLIQRYIYHLYDIAYDAYFEQFSNNLKE